MSTEGPAVETHPRRSLRILVIDPDGQHVSRAKEILGARGHRVLSVDTGQAGLLLAPAERPDAILFAHRLPDLDPLDLVRRLRVRLPDTPMILLVPPGHDDLEIESFDAGATDSLTLSPRYPDFFPKVVEDEVWRVDDRRQAEASQRATEAAAEQKRRVQERLDASEARLRLLIEQAPVVLWTTDRDLVFTSGMGAGLDALGIPPGSLRGKSIPELFRADGDSTPLAYHRRALEGESVRYEFGTAGRWFDVRLAPLRDHGAAIRGVLGVAFDITERKAAEAALRLSDERLRLLGLAATDVAWDWDLETGVIWQSENLAKVFGYSPEEAEPSIEWWEERVHPDDRERAVGSLYDAIEAGALSWNQEYRWRKKDGTYAPILDRGYFLRDDTGKPIRMVGSSIDLTGVRHQERLREAVYAISEAANRSRDLPDLYSRIHRIVAALLPASNFYIALHAPHGGELSFPYFVDEAEPAPPPQKLGRGLTEYVLRTGRPLLATPEVLRELVRKGEVEEVGPPGIDWLGVPLRVEDRTIGVLAVQTYGESVRYGREAAEVLTFVSEQVAMAIERKRAEDALRESEARFRGLVETSLVGIYIIQDGGLAYVNPRLAEIFGYTPPELTDGRPLTDLVAPEDRPVVTENLRRRMSGEIASLHYAFRGVRKDGTAIDLEVHGTRTDIGGHPAVIGALIDVTEAKRAEDDLRRSESRFRTLFEAAADAILLVTPKADILDVNPAAETLLESSRDRLLGRNVQEHLFPEDLERAREYLRDVLRSRSRREVFEIPLCTTTGGRRIVALRSRFVRETSSDAYVEMIARDVTEQRDMERRLVETQRLASMGQMAAYVAHEINTPLANIALLTASAQRLAKAADVRDKLEKINVQRRHAASIISDLLSISKQREIQASETELRPIIAAAIDQAQPYRKPGVELRFDLPKDLPPAWLDSLQMQEVFTNLIKNALEATAKGSVTVRAEAVGKALEVHVADTGSGISQEGRERLFEPFFTTKRQAGGTGLGLVFCRNVVRAHEGEILVESELGRGTTFTVVLPLREVHEAARGG